MKNKLIAIAAFAVFATTAAYSNHHAGSHEQETRLFHGAFLANLDRANEKVISLAEAFSDEQYEWRPAEGIRSVRESILHVVGANYGIGSMLGKAMPEGLNPWTLDKTISTKEATIEALMASIAFSKEAIASVSEDDLATMINLFGNDAPKMSAILIIGAHANEHLGQLIAYARSTGVTPPWSN